MQKIKARTFQKLFKEYGPDSMIKLRDEYGCHMYFNVPLVTTGVIIQDAKTIYQLLIKEAKDFVKPQMVRQIVKSQFVNGLLFLEGDEWHTHRQLMQPHFHHVHIQAYAERMVERTKQFSAQWNDDAIRDIGEDMRTLTADIVMSTLFSTENSPQSIEIRQAMHDFSEAFGVQMQNAWLRFLPAWFPLPVLQRQKSADRVLGQVIKKMLQERQQLDVAQRPKDLLTVLMDSRDADSGVGLTENELLAELMSLYIAGHETTAITVAWAWALLAQHPDIKEKFQAEIDTLLDGEPPTVDSLSRLRYTQWVIKETLRLYPPVWMILREATSEQTIDGVTFPKGTMFIFTAYPLHRDPVLYEQPHDFIPDRWANDFEKSLPKAAYFPFGIGARTCIGNGFAMMEAQLILATLAQHFDLELMTEAQVAHKGLTLGFKNAVKVRIHRR